MSTHGTMAGLAAAAIAAAGLSLSGCVTTDTFDKHVADEQAQHAALSARIDALDGRVNSVGQATAAAQTRADAAYRLAEGKFAMSEIGRESVSFDLGKSTLSTEAKATLTSLAERLKSENKNVFLEIQGHADALGGSKYNRELGRERAQATARFLHSQGIPGAKMQIGSYGEDNAKSNDADPANRRVDIVITG